MLTFRKLRKVINRALLIFVIVGLMTIAYLTINPPNRLLTSSHWSISASTIPSDVLWEKTIPCLGTGYISPPIAISDQSLHIYDDCAGFDGAIVTLDLQTGEQQSRFRLRTVYQVYGIDENILVVFSDSYVTLLNSQNNQVWLSHRFESRSMRRIAVYDDLINAYINDFGTEGIEVISITDGSSIQSYDNPSILAVFSEFYVEYLSGSLLLHSFNGDEVQLQISETISVNDKNNIYFDIHENTLFTYIDNHMYAHDITTGELNWARQGDYSSVPLLYDGIIFVYQGQFNITMYDAISGEITGNIELERDIPLENAVWTALAIDDNFLAIAYRNLGEVVVIRIN